MSGPTPPESRSRALTAEGGHAVTPPPPVNERYIHSDIYHRLVEDDDDLPGLVAYGLYQQRKRQWMDALQKEKGRQPSVDELKDHAFGYRTTSINALRNEAEGILFRFSESVMRGQLPDLQKEAFNSEATEKLGEIHTKLAKLGGYWHHIVGHVLGFIVLVLLVFFFTTIINYEVHLGSLFSKKQGTEQGH